MRLVTILTAAAFSATLAVGFAAAQQNPIEQRQHLMKENGRNAAVVSKTIKGELPFDAAKVNAAFDQWAETASKLTGLFPPDSKTGGDTRALPKIWQDRADFDKHIANFAKDVKEQRAKAASGLDGLKQAMAVIGKDCNGCHDEFRRKK